MRRRRGKIDADSLTEDIMLDIDKASNALREILRINILALFREIEYTKEEVDLSGFSIRELVRYFDEYASTLVRDFEDSLSNLYRDWLDFRGRETEERIGRRLSMRRVRGRIDSDSFMEDIKITIRDTLDSFMNSVLRSISDMFSNIKSKVRGVDISGFSTQELVTYFGERLHVESMHLHENLNELYIDWLDFLKRKDEEAEAERRRRRRV